MLRASGTQESSAYASVSLYNTEYVNKFKDPFSLKLYDTENAKPKCDPFLFENHERDQRRLPDIHV